MILFVLLVIDLVAVLLVFLPLLVQLLIIVVGLSMLCRNPLYLLLLSVGISFQLLSKSLFMNYL